MENISQMSLLEVAIYLMEQKKTKQPIRELIKEVLEMKGLDDLDGALATQLYIDITTSSKFVYMGNEEWDLKVRQSLDEYDKDGSAFNTKGEDLDDEDEDLSDEDSDEYEDDDYDDDDEDEDSEDDEEDEDSDEYEDDDYDDDEEDEDSEDDDDSIIDGEETERYSEDDDFDEDKYNDLMDDYEDIYE